MTTLAAFFVRDFRVAWSYKFSFLFQNASLVFSLLTLRFVADLFGESNVDAIAQYGGDYFSFALVGVGISVLAYPVTKSFAGAVRGAQVTGTFEAMLTTRTPGASIVVGSAAYGIAAVLVQLILIWVIGTLFFGANLRLEQLPVVALILAMTLSALTGIGLMSAAFVVAFKQSEPLSTAFVAASLLISGVMYPTSVLPAWLEALAPLLPLTHAAEVTRLLFITGAESQQVGYHLAALAGFCLLLPLGILALNRAIDYARRTGSLSQY
ncbi:MAG: ABC transporter permease [Dehalococcoidia bacterium]|nr:ABC transporter permease [Dehalococcoidia bacterium]